MPVNSVAPDGEKNPVDVSPLRLCDIAPILAPFLSKEKIISIAVAVSGGPDSMALLLLLKEWSALHAITLHALTVDHHLRKESANEAAQVAKWCEEQAIPHTILHWHHETLDHSIPEKARNARYALMFAWCREHAVPHLFTAHHLDDQIETFLFRLIRGSGLVGLAGMLPATQRDGIWLHRPLLGFPKSRLIATLKDTNHPYLEDPSNQNLAFTRNALRRHLHVLSAEQKRRFHIIFRSFLRFRKELEKLVKLALLECFQQDILNHTAFMSQPEELKIRILHHICHQVSGNDAHIRSEKIARLLANIEKGTGKYMLHGVMFHYQPKTQLWRITQTKSLAASHDLAQNKKLKQRKNNAQ